MDKFQRRLLLALLPLVLFGVLWIANWSRFHPAPTQLDIDSRKLLLAADRIDVAIVDARSILPHHLKFVSCLKPQDVATIVNALNLEPERGDERAGRGQELSFLFFKNGQMQAEITVGYGAGASSYFFVHPPNFPVYTARGLHPTTVRRFRELIASRPELRQALKSAGVKDRQIDS
jgi:hypothetical protein